MPISNQCLTCRHYHLGGACDAFKKIPSEIVTGEVDHREPYPGDNGIRWEPIVRVKQARA